MTVLNVHDLACLRGHRLVFSALSFRLEAGAAMVLHGPNGSGKTSLLRVLAGLIPAFSGKVFCGEGVTGDQDAADQDTVAEMITYVGHANPVKASLAVRENLHYWAAPYGTEDKVAPALEAMNLTAVADVQTRILSSGQQRRLALARLFVQEKPIWLLDEPGVGLDVESCKLLESRIAGHRRRGGIVLIATHIEIDLPGAKQLHMADFSETRTRLRKSTKGAGLDV